MMQKSNVSHGETKMDKMMRRRELPCIRRSRSFYGGRVVRCAMLLSMERKKSDQEAKKRQSERLTKKAISCRRRCLKSNEAAETSGLEAAFENVDLF
jgi:hypothetical protein